MLSDIVDFHFQDQLDVTEDQWQRISGMAYDLPIVVYINKLYYQRILFRERKGDIINIGYKKKIGSNIPDDHWVNDCEGQCCAMGSRLPVAPSAASLGSLRRQAKITQSCIK